MADGAVIIGLDVGTTHAKAAAHGADLRRWAWASRELPLRVSEPGRVEQDPQVWRDTALGVLAEVGAQVAARGGHVAGVCLGTAMHGLIGLDARGEAVTPLVTWADQRAVEQALRLRAEASSAALARRTGAPLHAMTPLAKLIWFREQEPA
ncbi:MAG TPA: FGGY family carbohydrate kinase, partial [Longimicrobium sp.]|nr:FGGY family carbohydrate kinase [Longimicrobium sp.]